MTTWFSSETLNGHVIQIAFAQRIQRHAILQHPLESDEQLLLMAQRAHCLRMGRRLSNNYLVHFKHDFDMV